MKNKIITLVAGLALIISACQEQKKSKSSEPDLKDIAYEAFIYSYPLMEQVKTINGMQEFMGIEFNKPAMNTKLPWDNVGMPIVAPNLTSMTGGILLDLSSGPVSIEIPEIKDRYNVFQCIDVYTHNFFYMGSRATQGEAGQYTFFNEKNKPKAPIGTPVLVEGNQVVIVVRIDIKNEAEHEKIIALQKAIKIIDAPLGKTDYPTYSKDKAFSPDFVEYINELLVETPKSEAAMFERFNNIGIKSDVKLSVEEKEQVQSGIDSAFLAINKEVASLEIGNGYIGATDVFGTREFLNGNYLGRAAGANFGLWGNSKEEANYFMTFVEGEGVISFKKEELPPLSEIGFWSVTAHDENVLVHKNEYDSYVLTLDKMKFEADGSLNIKFSSKPEEGNWLYTPGGKMVILIRVYQANPDKISSYIPPAFQAKE